MISLVHATVPDLCLCLRLLPYYFPYVHMCDISLHLLLFHFCCFFPFLFISFHIVIGMACRWMSEGRNWNQRKRRQNRKKGKEKQEIIVKGWEGNTEKRGKRNALWHEGHFTRKSHSAAEWMRRVRAFSVKWNQSHPAWELKNTGLDSFAEELSCCLKLNTAQHSQEYTVRREQSESKKKAIKGKECVSLPVREPSGKQDWNCS